MRELPQHLEAISIEELASELAYPGYVKSEVIKLTAEASRRLKSASDNELTTWKSQLSKSRTAGALSMMVAQEVMSRKGYYDKVNQTAPDPTAPKAMAKPTQSPKASNKPSGENKKERRRKFIYANNKGGSPTFKYWAVNADGSQNFWLANYYEDENIFRGWDHEKYQQALEKHDNDPMKLFGVNGLVPGGFWLFISESLVKKIEEVRKGSIRNFKIYLRHLYVEDKRKENGRATLEVFDCQKWLKKQEEESNSNTDE